MVLEKTLESPLDCKEIKPVNPKGNQPWIFIGRTDAEAEPPILWPKDVKNWLIGKDPDAGKDWRQEEKGTTEDEMVGWHHWLDGHEFEQSPGVGEGQGSLACRIRHDWETELNRINRWSDLSQDSSPVILQINQTVWTRWSLEQRSSTFLAPGTGFLENAFSTDWGVGDGLGMIQACYMYCALYFYYYYTTSTSDHQASGPGGWRPLV